MPKFQVEGVIPPMITPFDDEGNLYEKGLRRLIDFLAERVQALYPVGTYGTGPGMSFSERQRAAEIIVEQVAHRIPVIMHVGCVDTKSTVALARHAEKIGADAVASIAPFYYEHNDRAIEYHFQQLMGAVSIPVFAYNNPKLSRNSISPGLLAKLAEQGLAGIKDSSFDILVYYAYLRMVKKPDFTFIIGTEALALPALVVGGSACVAGLANALPELVVDLYRACRSKDLEAAAVLQQKTLVVREIMHLAPIAISGIHAILQMRGIDAGIPRAPILPLTPEVSQKMKARLQEEGML
ncbi:MAG: dihydrodipicolinate synthase family protein [bacterium]|jgi:dihydrodipicolinate synthase/N-acetylneuraminate lyase